MGARPAQGPAATRSHGGPGLASVDPARPAREAPAPHGMCPQQRRHRRRRRRGARCAAKPGRHRRGTGRGGAGRARRAGQGLSQGEQLLTAPAAPRPGHPHAPCKAAAPRPQGGGRAGPPPLTRRPRGRYRRSAGPAAPLPPLGPAPSAARAPLPACFCFLPPSDTAASGAADWLAPARRRSQSAGGDAGGWGREGVQPSGKAGGEKGGGRNHLGGVSGEGAGRSHSCGEGRRGGPGGWARGPPWRGP